MVSGLGPHVLLTNIIGGSNTNFAGFIGQGFVVFFFVLILRHETKVGRVFYLVFVIFLFLSSSNNFYLIPSI